MRFDYLTPHRDSLLSALRIMAGLLMLNYGMQKIIGFPAARMPPAGSLSWIAGLFELVLGFLVTIGFSTRLAAFVMSGVMAFAYFISHFPKGFYPSLNGGTAAALFCFVFLYLAAAGPGRFSVDRALERK